MILLSLLIFTLYRLATPPVHFVSLWGVTLENQGVSAHGGIAQLGAHQTSETSPFLSEKFAKLAVDNLRKMYYNKQCWLVNQR